MTDFRPKHAWLKWYPTDWRADPALRMCSLAARGLWIDLLGYMHEAKPYGHLVINGKAPSTAQLATLVGAPLQAVTNAMTELEAAGVYTVNEDGIIVSRRMLRDAAKAAKDSANGSKGGNPNLIGHDNGGVNPEDKAHGKALPDARSQKPEEPNPKVKTKAPTDRSESTRAAPPPPLPAAVSPELWQTWRDHRKRLRAPMTPHAEALLAKDLHRFANAGHNPVTIIETAIARGWKGLFEPKGETHGTDRNAQRAATIRGLTGGLRLDGPDEHEIPGTAERYPPG